MDEKRANQSSLTWTAVMVLLIAALPLYVLSIGPVLYLANSGFPGFGKSLEPFYAPLVWVAEQWLPLDYALKRYIAWWLS